MACVHLHGDLQKFGGPFALAVDTPAEAVRALCFQIRGFRRRLAEGVFRVVRKGRAHERDLSVEALDSVIHDHHELHIIPVVAGSKSGAGKAIMGVALVAAAFIAAPAVIGAMGPTLGMGTTAFSVAGFGVTFSQIAGFGAMMALGGIAQMLSPTPKSSVGGGGGSARADTNASFVFNGAVNVAAQGEVVPLVYGRFTAGSVVVSDDLSAEQMA